MTRHHPGQRDEHANTSHAQSPALRRDYDATMSATHREPPWAHLGMKDVFLRLAQSGSEQLFWINSTTALSPGGHNGPYFDVETPVRNSAHWLASMSIAYSLTGDKNFRRSGEALTRFLLSSLMKIAGVHVHRQRFPKDWTNGVIGPAWVSEGLMLAGRHLDIDVATRAGADLLRGLGFDEERSLWQASDPATDSRGTDRTVNHQVFCTAIAAEFNQDSVLRSRVDRFIENSLGVIVRTGQDGVLQHHVPMSLAQRLAHRAFTAARNRTGARFRRAAMRHGSVPDAALRDVGYHVFSLYSISRLAAARPSAQLAMIPEVRAAASAVTSIISAPHYPDNPYGYAYNPVGFELPAIVSTPGFEGIVSDEVVADAYRLQMDQTSEPDTGLLTRSTLDPLVLSARGYELGLLYA